MTEIEERLQTPVENGEPKKPHLQCRICNPEQPKAGDTLTALCGFTKTLTEDGKDLTGNLEDYCPDCLYLAEAHEAVVHG